MKKNIKRVMGILLAATMSISLVMPAFASQTSNTDTTTEVQEQNEQAAVMLREPMIRKKV